MSYACTTCGKATRIHDTRGVLRIRKCSSNHRERTIEIPFERHEANLLELDYLRALREAIQPQLDAFALELLNLPFSPEPNAYRHLKKNPRYLKNVIWEPGKKRFIVRVHYKRIRLTLYTGPDLFEAACIVLSWKNKHDYNF